MIKEKDEMIRLLNALFPGVKIYLFGSRARGNYKPTSDIDLALDTGTVLSLFDLAKARNVLDALYIPQKIDVVDFNSVPEALKNIIVKEGVEWKI